MSSIELLGTIKNKVSHTENVDYYFFFKIVTHSKSKKLLHIGAFRYVIGSLRYCTK